MYRKKIIHRLHTLKDIQRVNVKVSKEGKSVTVTHEKERSLDFEIKWSKNHFIGYFVDSEASSSQAVLSLWIPLDAVHFVTSYSLLVELRASRPSPLNG